MLRLGARLDHPYLVAITVPTGDASIAATITDPTGAATALTLVDAGDARTAQITPSVPGPHVLEVTASDDPAIVGIQAGLDVATSRPGHLIVDPGQTDPDCLSSQRLLWPCPDLAALPGITNWGVDAVARWMGDATDTMFADAGFRFPGCHRYVRLRPRVSGSCLCLTPSGRLGFDLWPILRYPALELLDVMVDGVADDLADWQIERHRWLVPADGVSWPNQDWQRDNDTTGTWSILVRYGRPVPALAVRARDQWALSMLCEIEPTTAGDLACRIPPNATQVTENNRVIALDPEQASVIASTLATQVARRWGTKRRQMSRLADPADASGPGTGMARVVPGDHTPTDHALWLNSGCDLSAELALVTP